MLFVKLISKSWTSFLFLLPFRNSFHAESKFSIRFTLGSKIDEIFLSSIEYCFLASYSKITEKIILLDRCISRVDLLKLLIELAWDIHALDNKKYAEISERLFEIGRMLGGWRRQLINKTPPTISSEKKWNSGAPQGNGSCRSSRCRTCWGWACASSRSCRDKPRCARHR